MVSVCEEDKAIEAICLTTATLVSDKPCLLYSIFFYTTLPVAVLAIFYDGFGINAPIKLRCSGHKASTKRNKEFRNPIKFTKGLYVNGVDVTKPIFITYKVL